VPRYSNNEEDSVVTQVMKFNPNLDDDQDEEDTYDKRGWQNTSYSQSVNVSKIASKTSRNNDVDFVHQTDPS